MSKYDVLDEIPIDTQFADVYDTVHTASHMYTPGTSIVTDVLLGLTQFDADRTFSGARSEHVTLFPT